MNNKKGFTLVELLAVILIIALLAAVGITAVTRYMSLSKKNTAIESGASLYQDANTYYLLNKDKINEKVTVTFPDSNNILEIASGNEPDEGTITISVDGSISFLVKYKDMWVKKDINKNKIYIYEGPKPAVYLINKEVMDKSLTGDWNYVGCGEANQCYYKYSIVEQGTSIYRPVANRWYLDASFIGGSSSITTSNKIDFTDVKSVTADFDLYTNLRLSPCSKSDGKAIVYLGLTNVKQEAYDSTIFDYYNNYYQIKEGYSMTPTSNEYNIDTSNLTGEYT